MTEPAKVPLYLLGGPLGAGKTTLLLRLLAYWKSQGMQVGVLMNEAGAISVDGAHAAPLAAAVWNMTGGCVCCDARDSVLAGLTELVAQRSVDIVVLECSGIADIEEVIDAVTDPPCLALTMLAKVIAVIEPAVPSTSLRSARGTPLSCGTRTMWSSISETSMRRRSGNASAQPWSGTTGMPVCGRCPMPPWTPCFCSSRANRERVGEEATSSLDWPAPIRW